MSLSIDDILWVHYHQFLDLAVSPDDQEVLVVFGNQDMPHDSYSMDEMNRSIWGVRLSDGTAFQLAPQEEDAHTPCWSPDGCRIAYLSRRSGQTEIWIMNRDGTDAHQVTHSSFPARNPFDGSSLCWSPDGMSIAYTVVPNGGRYTLARKDRDGTEQIVVHHAMTDDERRKRWNHPPSFEGAVYIVYPESGRNRRLASCSGETFRILGWFPDSKRLVVSVGLELKEITISTGKMRSLYSGPLGLVTFSAGDVRLARLSGSHIEVGSIEGGSFKQKYSIEVAGYDIRFDAWSRDGSRLFGRMREGVTTYLFAIDLGTSSVQRLTQSGRSVLSSGPKCLHQKNTVVFSYQGPTEPAELWLHRPGDPLRKVSSFNKKLVDAELSEVRIIQYPSDGWMIEALLVLPLHYVQGKKYPTLVYLHGGPEYYVGASFTDLISARAQSAAHYLAIHDYAVLLPNFRGSSGYGPEFEKELGDYQMMHKPYQDVIAGVNYLIDEGITDPGKLGIYGTSFGGWLTAWAVSQSNRFKGAVAALGLYDMLRQDRTSGTAFHAYRPNRLGNADPADMWSRPEIYKEFSPMEHIRSINTPVLLVETGAERRHGQARMFFNGLCALGVESYLVYYPKAFHSGGWNDEYKRDYMNRLVAWFDHCLKDSPLPGWFKQNVPSSGESE